MSDENLVAFAAMIARATVDKAAAEIPVGRLVPATVLGPPPASATGTMLGVVMVQLDRDLPTSVPLPAAVITGVPPVAGQRVMVQESPPWGLYVAHSIGETPQAVGRISARCNGGGGG